MKVSPFNPPTHNLDPFYARQIKPFLVRTVTTDFVGRLITDERIIHAPSVKSVKRSIYLSLSNVRSISIVEVAVKK